MAHSVPFPLSLPLNSLDTVIWTKTAFAFNVDGARRSEKDRFPTLKMQQISLIVLAQNHRHKLPMDTVPRPITDGLTQRRFTQNRPSWSRQQITSPKAMAINDQNRRNKLLPNRMGNAFDLELPPNQR